MDDAPASPPRSRYVIGVLLVLGLVAAGLALGRRPHATDATASETRAIMGTTVAVTVVAESEEAAAASIAAAFARIEALDRVLSAHRQDSELARLNREGAQRPVPVSADLYRILDAAVRWHARTLGAFDVTVGPLIGLWKQCGRENRLPTPEEIERVRPLLGANRIELDPAARTVKLPVEGMRIDLGGLGKGFVADEVAQLLVRRGVTRALVSMSGDIYALGPRADGQPWRVGVQDPRRPYNPDALVTVLALADRAVSTSGNYQRYVEIQGKRYSHIIDPRTGRTADDVPSVTVIGPDTLTTDILDTAFSVLGVEQSRQLLERLPGVEALFITPDADGRAQATRSKGFARYELPDTPHDVHLK